MENTAILLLHTYFKIPSWLIAIYGISAITITCEFLNSCLSFSWKKTALAALLIISIFIAVRLFFYPDISSHIFNFYIMLFATRAIFLFRKDFFNAHKKMVVIFAVTGILLLSLMYRVDKLVEYENALLDPDAINYRKIALNSHSFYDSDFREPLFVFLIKVYSKVFGTEYAVMRYLTVVLSISCIALIYITGKELFQNEWVGLLSALMAGVNSYLIFMSVRLLRLELFIITILLLFLILFVSHAKNNLRYIMIGIIGGLVCLTRITSLLFVIPLICFAFWQEKTPLAKIIIPVLLIIAMTVPHFMHNKKKFGNYNYSIDKHAIWYRNQEFKDQPGFPTSQDLAKNSYQGDPITSFEYIFGMHSLRTVILRSLNGFGEIFFGTLRKAFFSSHDVLVFFLCGGYIWVLFSQYRYLWGVMILLIGPTFFLAGTLSLDPRLVAHIYPFMVFITAFFIISISKLIFRFIQNRVPAVSFLKRLQ